MAYSMKSMIIDGLTPDEWAKQAKKVLKAEKEAAVAAKVLAEKKAAEAEEEGNDDDEEWEEEEPAEDDEEAKEEEPAEAEENVIDQVDNLLNKLVKTPCMRNLE